MSKKYTKVEVEGKGWARPLPVEATHQVNVRLPVSDKQALAAITSEVPFIDFENVDRIELVIPLNQNFDVEIVIYSSGKTRAGITPSGRHNE